MNRTCFILTAAYLYLLSPALSAQSSDTKGLGLLFTDQNVIILDARQLSRNGQACSRISVTFRCFALLKRRIPSISVEGCLNSRSKSAASASITFDGTRERGRVTAKS